MDYIEDILMDTVHTIIITILVLMIVFNIYYALYVKRSCLEGFEVAPKPYNDITILPANEYTSEQDSFNGFFQECKANCGTTFARMEKNDADFLNKHSQYHKNYSFNNIVNTSVGYGTYTDIMQRKPLLAYRCLNKSPLELKNILSRQAINYAHIYKKLYIYDETMLVNFVKKQIDAVLNTNCYKYDTAYEHSSTDQVYCDANLKLLTRGNRSDSIQSPVYVIVSQSPYLRINEENKARFDIVQNQLPYFVEQRINGNKITQKQTGDANSEFSSLYAEILIVFPMYKTQAIPQTDAIAYSNMNHMVFDIVQQEGDVDGSKTATLKDERLKKFLALIAQYEVSDELCKLTCNKTTQLKCGCLNAKESDMDFSNRVPVQNRPYINPAFEGNISSIKKYNSVCLSPQDIQINRSIMYYINPYSGIFMNVMNNSNRNLPVS